MSKFKEERDAAAEAYINSVEYVYAPTYRKRKHFGQGFNACLESSVVKNIIEKANAVLKEESDKNAKKIQVVDGVKYYPISGNFAKNIAFNELDRALNAYEQALAEIRGEK